jgi:hypothetical protein
MSTIFRKIAVFFGLKSPEQVTMDDMLDMKEQENYFDDIETMPG